jgi:plastocyanin
MKAVSLIALVVAALHTTACQAAQPAPADDRQITADVNRIEMHADRFTPEVVQVSVGTVVTWAFTDQGRGHNVVGDGFASEVLSEGAFTHRFASPGDYDYQCTLHRGMTGRVLVVDS